MPKAVMQQLRERVRGEVIEPGAAGYDEARSVWNAGIDRRPAIVVRPAGVSDVIEAVKCAASQGLQISVRSGGHNVSGSAVCDHALMIDLSRMKGVHVDPASRTARAAPGATWGEFDRETQVFGLATTGGFCSEAGLGGVTLGAGFGWLMRKYGTTLDNLRSFDLVLPDGEFVHASKDENEELFFAVRGSHSNFGVVTSFEFALHPIGPLVTGGMVVHPLANARPLLQFYRDFAATAPIDLGSAPVLMTLPDGNKAAAIVVCHHGPEREAEAALADLRSFGPPMADMIQPMPYVAVQSMFDDAFPRGRRSYWKSSFLRELSDAAIDALVGGFESATSPFSSILIEHLGGAVGAVASDAAAFSHRSFPFNCVIMPIWERPADTQAQQHWADSVWSAIQPAAADAVYVNYLGNEGPDRVKAAYGTNYDRLRSLKKKFDPENRFAANQNLGSL